MARRGTWDYPRHDAPRYHAAISQDGKKASPLFTSESAAATHFAERHAGADMAETPPDHDNPPAPPDDTSSGSPDITAAEAIPYWQRHAARWRRHAARFQALATQAQYELRDRPPSPPSGPVSIDPRPGRYWWFNHMAAIYAGWASRAEQRLRVLQDAEVAPS